MPDLLKYLTRFSLRTQHNGIVFFVRLLLAISQQLRFTKTNTSSLLWILPPQNPGHTLVIPKHHYRNIFDMPIEVGSKIMQAAIPIANAIRTALNPDGLNLFQSNEAAGFQTVFHFHLHLIPRWEGDPLRLPWRPSEGNMAEIGNIADKIRQALLV